MAFRVLAVLFLFALASCAKEGGMTGGSSDGSGTITVELSADDPEPMALLFYGNHEQEGRIGTHCWLEQCVDFLAPPPPLTFTPIPSEVEIQFTGNGYPGTLSVGRQADAPIAPLEDEREIPIEDRRAQLELDPGRHVLVVFATWSEGDAVFAFGIEASD